MKRKLGLLCMILGVGLVLGAAYLLMTNQQEDTLAQESSESVMPALVQQIREKTEATMPESDTQPEPQWQPELELNKPVELLTEEEKKMTEVVIGGIPYIGYLSIPKLGLELPIISTWSGSLLKLAPCRYVGTVRGENLVLMAHNYASHFGSISQLEEGDTVTFTDMDGETTCYEVVGEDILEPTAVEEMTAGVFDLTLFTCTYGGKHRITVYCNQTDPQA